MFAFVIPLKTFQVSPPKAHQGLFKGRKVLDVWCFFGKLEKAADYYQAHCSHTREVPLQEYIMAYSEMQTSTQTPQIHFWSEMHLILAGYT